jgi:hypothetical protein
LGQYFDYFCARDAKTAKAIAAKGSLARSKDVDGFSMKGIDPEVRVAELIAFIRGVEWTPETIRLTSVWPPESTKPKTPDDFDRLPEDSPWWTSEYHLDEFDLECRDELASMGDLQLRRLSEEWAPTENFEDYDPDGVRSDFERLVNLAKRAQAANERLFVISPAG